jgi:hypothetical protein
VDANRHYSVSELIDILEHAKQNKKPVYAAEGPCGGCDLVIGEPKKMDIEDRLQKLKSQHPLRPFYPGLQGPCGGCDICILPK